MVCVDGCVWVVPDPSVRAREGQVRQCRCEGGAGE